MVSKAAGAYVAAFLLAFTLTCCATPAIYTVDLSNYHPFLGGPEYRVFDVYEINSPDLALSMREIYALAEQCTGQTRDYSKVRVFTVSKIEVSGLDGWISTPYGVWAIGTGWVYVKRGRSPKATTRTLVHELAHYITQLHHPEIDPIIAVCNELVQQTKVD